LGLEVIGAGTIFAAPNSSRTAFATLVEGSRWMTIMNAVTNVSHWDLVSPWLLVLHKNYLFPECPFTVRQHADGEFAVSRTRTFVLKLM
jgi:hypothetical protein